MELATQQGGGNFMFSIGEDLRKVILAGVGAVAQTSENAQKLLDDLVHKGELTVEQGKVLNEELKHTVKEKVKSSIDVILDGKNKNSLIDQLDTMTPDELEQLREKLSAMEETQNAADTAKPE